MLLSIVIVIITILLILSAISINVRTTTATTVSRNLILENAAKSPPLPQLSADNSIRGQRNLIAYAMTRTEDQKRNTTNVSF